MKFSTVAAFASLGSVALAAPASSDSESLAIEKRTTLATKMTATDKRLFSNTLSSFISYRKTKSPSYLVWASDGCTKSPDKPFGWNFQMACYRHDFGYRNYQKQKRFTSTNKSRIDTKFLDDLLWVCNNQASLATMTNCYSLAVSYHNIMRLVTNLKRQVEGDDGEDDGEYETLPGDAEPGFDPIEDTEFDAAVVTEINNIRADFELRGIDPSTAAAISDADLAKIDLEEDDIEHI